MKRYLDDLVLKDLSTNGHGNNAAPDKETCHVLFPHPILPPLAGEGANDSLREFHVKSVVLTGPRQVGKTTLARQLMSSFGSAQYLNWEGVYPKTLSSSHRVHREHRENIVIPVFKASPNW